MKVLYLKINVYYILASSHALTNLIHNKLFYKKERRKNFLNITKRFANLYWKFVCKVNIFVSVLIIHFVPNIRGKYEIYVLFSLTKQRNT